jgi:drug/metabolite transporter (DMT)-like permease
MKRFIPLLFVVLWATGFIGARAGMPYAEPGTFLLLRFIIAFALLACIALALKAPWPRGRALLGALVVGMLVHGVYLGGVFWAIDRGMPAGIAAVVVGLQPLLTAVIAGVYLGEVVTARHRTGIVLGLLGVMLVLLPGIMADDTVASSLSVATVVVVAVATLAVTTGTVLQKRLGLGVDLRSGTALQYLGAAIPVALLATTEAREITWNGQLVFALVWLVFVLSLGAVFLLMWLIREGSVSQVAALFYLVPAVTSLIAWALFDETLGVVQLLGMALTAVAVWLATSSREPGKNQA